ncbi:MAG TPA: hypothetical protein VEV37_08055 [Bryobacteraceae bacterium]|nr:hypothetical protein [Bryobacteraceae bacterium]
MEPYLSVVVAALEGTESERSKIQLFVDTWADQAKRQGLASEIIIAGTAAPVLNLPNDLGSCEVRLVTAPAEAGPAKAKNAGIREARGQFILATNPGILFTDELVNFLASFRLEPDCLYRADRYDVDGNPSGIGAEQRLSYCRKHSLRLHAREGTFDLTPDGLRRNAPDDIAPVDSGINFGSGWFPPEKYACTAETFRWAHDDAEILARVREGGDILLLEVEPGPSLASLPQRLELIDEDGYAVASWNIARRTTVAVAVPGKQPAIQRLRLRITGGGRPILDNDRILNLAVFGCNWAERNRMLAELPSIVQSLQQSKPTLGRMLGSSRKTSGVFHAIARGPFTAMRAAGLLSRRGRDVFEAWMDFQLGPGWSYLEESGSERFRWVSRDATFFLRMPESTSRVALLLEPGPSQRDQPLHFVARLANQPGAILIRRPVIGLTYFEFPVPAAPGSIAALNFTGEGAVDDGGDDKRSLSYRVFACGAGAREILSPPLSKHWPVLPLNFRPAAQDWIAAFDPVKRDLDEMGHPAHLHTKSASDFLLMSRSRWLDIRGFPEIAMTPDRLDALLCYAAHHCGAREEVLSDPVRVYRIGNRPTEAGHYSMAPAVQQEDLMWLIAQMRSLHAPVIFNRADWGR